MYLPPYQFAGLVDISKTVRDAEAITKAEDARVYFNTATEHAVSALETLGKAKGRFDVERARASVESAILELQKVLDNLK